MLHFCDVQPLNLTSRSRSNNVISCECIAQTVGRSNFKLDMCIYHMMGIVLGNTLCDLDRKVKGQIIYFLLNASPKLLGVTSNFAAA